MIGYLCKYTPVEIFHGFNVETMAVSPEENNFTLSDSLIHPNLCSFSKAVLQHCIQNNLNEMVFTNCCDSLKRVYDVLRGNLQFHFMLNLPRVVTPESIQLFSAQLLEFINAYQQYSNISFNITAFKQAIRQASGSTVPRGDAILLLGARVPASLLSIIQDNTTLPVLDGTCAGQCRCFSGMPDSEELSDLMIWYAAALLEQIPCMRMQAVSARENLLSNPGIKGIVYHTVKFCDYYGFEYARLKEADTHPILKLETDFTAGSAGQIQTRLQAFYESLHVLQQPQPALAQNEPAARPALTKRRIFCGIDCGSTSTDAVLIDEDKNILAYSILPTGARSSEGSAAALHAVLQSAGIEREDIRHIVATGYGRNAINYGDSVTEITCHAKGAFFLNPNVRTIIDVGGQDSKIIKLDQKGNIIDFTMNDKCAAGTGRFLDMMANTLQLRMEDFALLGLDWKEDIQISSMCSVFAESEVISLIAQNKAKQDIIHGLNRSITARIFAMAARLKCTPLFMMTGGVAKNQGVVSEMSVVLGEQIHTASEPQICGALGAALIALER